MVFYSPKMNYINFIFAFFHIVILSNLILCAKCQLDRITGRGSIFFTKFDPYRWDIKFNKTIE